MTITEPDDFATRLRAAMAARNLPLDRLQAHLGAAGVPVSAATLSYWRSGRSRPSRRQSLDAVAELERILLVTPGHLSAPLAERPAEWDPLGVLPRREITESLLAGLTTDLTRRWRRLTVETFLEVDGDRRETRQTTRITMTALVDGAHGWPLVVYGDDAHARATLQAVSGCVLGDVRPVVDAPILVAEMFTPRPLARGEHAMVEYRTDFVDAHADAHRVGRSLPGPTLMLSLGVRFAGELPRTFTMQAQSPTGGPLVVGAPSLIGSVLRSVTVDAAVGTYDLEWAWTA
ncbi:MAG: hypothetical protein L0G22_06125 [Propionibacteriaceae bacterium]|nr:hypothetical protein [Propionibacteriaceae bacterium]